jgi:hypothetical protein
MSERDLPELPSDEELGIAGLDEEEILREMEGRDEARSGEGPGGGLPSAKGPPGPPPHETTSEHGDAARRPRGGWLPALVAAVVLLVGVWGSSHQRSLPSPVPANAPDTVFSSSRAMAKLVELAREPRPMGAPEHTRVRELIEARLRELRLEPELQTSLSVLRVGQSVQAATLRNLMVRIPGVDPTGAVLLMTHYDGVPHSPAAADAGVGVVVLLELLRALQSGPPLANDLIVLFTDGEETGLLGARAFMEAHPWMDDVELVLNLDMRGASGPSIMFETGRENGWVVQALAEADPRPMAHSLSVEVYRQMPNSTDFTIFREVGIQGMNFASIGDSWVHHQATDLPANVREAAVQHHGMRLLALTRALGNRELSRVDARDRAHFVVPGMGLVHFSVGWVSPAAAGVGILWLLVVALGLARGMGFPAMGVGFLAATACAVAAAAVGWGAMQWLPRFHPEFGYLTPAFYGEGWYMMALAAVALALVSAVFGWVRRWFSLPGLAAGALLLPVLGGVVMGLTVPLAAPVLLGPAAAGLLAVGVAAVAGGPGAREVPGPSIWIAGILLALPVLAFLVPVIELLWAAMSLRWAAALGALATVMLLCLLPLLDVLGTPNRWWTPAAAAAGALVFVLTGIWLGGPSPERPLPSTLIYGLQGAVIELEPQPVGSPEVADTVQVLADPGPTFPRAMVELLDALDDTVPTPTPGAPETGEPRAYWISLEDPGRSWAESRVGPLLDGPPPGGFGLGEGHRSAPTAAVEMPAPLVRVLELDGPQADGSRSVRLGIVSRVGAEALWLEVPEGEGAIPTALGGEPLPPAPSGVPGARRPVTRILHHGLPEGALTLDLHLEPGVESVRLQLTEEHLRPWALLGTGPFERPPHLMPRAGYRPLGGQGGTWRGGIGDRAILVTPVVVPLGWPLP